MRVRIPSNTLASLVHRLEYFLGKEGVVGSIPTVGFEIQLGV
jgi:hypothetical protein